MATQLSHIRVKLTDELGGFSFPRYYLNATTTQTIAQAIVEAQALASLLDPLTGSLLSALTFEIIVPLPGGLKPAATAGSRDVLQAALSLTNDNDAYKWQVPIPAILPAKLSGQHLNTGDAAVAAFIAHLTGTSSAYRYASKWGGNLVALSHTFLSDRQRTARPKSF